jgi:hypothetical protein
MTGGAPGGKSTGSGSGPQTASAILSTPRAPTSPTPDDQAPTITRLSAPKALPPDWSSQPSSADTYDRTGRLLTSGSSSYVPNPSAGQIFGALSSIGPYGALTSSAAVAASALNGDTTYDGGAIGRVIDGIRGVAPGQSVGFVGNHVASNTNARGDRPADDTRLMDRSGAAARDALGGAPDDGATGDDGDAEFSSVRLADRRRPYDDLSAVDLLRGLL